MQMYFNQIAVSLYMDQELALKLAKEYIDEGKMSSFTAIFEFVEKTTIQRLTGMNYYKLLRVAKNPKKIIFEDIYTIGHALKVDPQKLTLLIHRQINEAKATKKPTKG